MSLAVAVVPALGCQVVADIREREFQALSDGGSGDDATDFEDATHEGEDAETADGGPSKVDAAPGEDGNSVLDADARIDVGAGGDARIGDAADGGIPRVSTKSFLDVGAMDNRTCGVRNSDRAIECWGEALVGNLPAGMFSKVAVGGSHACGLTTGGVITCWGDNANGQTSVPAGTYKAVTLGRAHSCGHRTDQTIVCWGDNGFMQSSPLVPSSYGQLTAGGDRTCALGFDNVASCWGQGAGLQARPAAQFLSIATGALKSCGVRKDRMAISCWGPDGSALSFERSGAFNQSTVVSVGLSQVCAIDMNSSLGCWNGDTAAPTEVPTDKFTVVSVGTGHVCALRPSDSKVVCWGNNELGQATPP
jgi:hypothetical protein